MEFLKISENATSEQILKVLDKNREIAASMRAFVAEGDKILNSVAVLPSDKVVEDVPVSSKREGFTSDPSVDMNDVNYYLDAIKSYEVDQDLSSNLAMFLPDNKPLLYRVAAELLKEEKEAFEFVSEYALETGASSEEIHDLESEARILGDKRNAVLGILGIKEDCKGKPYVKKQGDN